MLSHLLNAKFSGIIRRTWPFLSIAMISIPGVFFLVFFVIFGIIFRWVRPESSFALALIPASILAIVIGISLEIRLGKLISRKYSGRTLLIVNFSSEANDVLEKLAERSGGDKADVLRKSLGLMELAMQAHEQGQAVGATNQPEVLETEFTGF